MISHILVPLDGSQLAECVLPHVYAVAQALNARITLLHVLERPRETGELPADPMYWHSKKNARVAYLDHVTSQLQNEKLQVTNVVLEGKAAEGVIEYAKENDVDLIALSTHGSSGLSGWNVSSIVQKIILRAYKSVLLVRAYKESAVEIGKAHKYKRLFVGLDCSGRAEMVLPVAVALSQHYKARLILGTVIRMPDMIDSFPLSDEDQELLDRFLERKQQIAEHYFQLLSTQCSLQGIELQTVQVVSNNVITTLHDVVEQENADLMMLVAHGASLEHRWPYGSVATSFIAYGSTALIILQDLPRDTIQETQAELAARETTGH